MNAARRLRRRSAKIASRVAAALDAAPSSDSTGLYAVNVNYMPRGDRREISIVEAREMYPLPPNRSDYRRKVAALKTRR